MPPGPPYYVYLLSNRARTVLYVGMTNGLVPKAFGMREHQTEGAESFTGRYNVTDLVYYERHETARAAIDREKQLKRWGRDKKEALIRSENPDLDTLPPPVD